MTICRVFYTKKIQNVILLSEKHQISRSLASSAVFQSFNDDQYQYLQRGQIPMLHFQRSLPRLPVPKLENTCSRFLAASRPLISDSSYDELKNAVERFMSTGPGMKLQKHLLDHDKENLRTSYISKPWFDMYLSDRRPLPINYNPVVIMKYDPRPEYNDILTRTSNLVLTSLRFMRSLRDELLEPEVYHMNPKKSDTQRYRNILSKTPSMIATFVSYAFKAFPLDMSQYQGLFGATRIPEPKIDRIYRSESSTHICVMRNGHIYALNVLDGDGNIVSPSKIINRLKFVLNDESSSSLAEYPLGVLTAIERNEWADIRKHLIEINAENSFEVIDSALLCVSLDDNSTFDLDNPVPIVQNMLHGDKNGLHNRWFDKSISLIVCKDGTAGINFEHSWGDGVAVLRYFNEIYKETIESPIIHPNDVKNTPNENVSEDVFKVELNLDDRTRNAIKNAWKTYQLTVDSLEMNAMIYKEMNKVFCKEHQVSPDAIMQLGFQLAYFKQHREYVGTYESCSTAAFRHGRTETVRPCTSETKLFCDTVAAAKSSMSQRDLRKLIVQCSNTHGRLIKEAAMGQGFDRHLFALKIMSEKYRIPLDPIYEHEAYKKLNCNILSSSTLSAPGLLAGGFGAVERNGYGIGYNIQEEFLGTIITNYVNEKNGADYAERLRESYDQIRNILISK